MDALMTLLALALPVLLGVLWLNLLVPAQTTARAGLVWGSGILLGLLFIPQLMHVLDALGMGLSFWPTAALAIVLAALAPAAGSLRHTALYPEARAVAAIPALHKALFLFLAALLVLRVAVLGLEVLWRPLFPWDATMHWATKARVWFEHRHMVPFVENWTWLEMGGEGVFTDRHPSYPATIPLLQVWMNLAVGHWDESLMNLPWLLCLVALGSAFYSQLRISGCAPLMAMIFTYFLLSMPLINTHVALAGYADLFLGAAYCGALMAFHGWVNSGQRWRAILMILFLLACPLIKNEGYLWALSLVPAYIIAVATRPKEAVVKLTVLVLVALVLLASLLVYRPMLMDQTLGQLTGLDMRALLGIVKSIWLHGNWHLLGYLIPVIFALSLILPAAVTRPYRGIATALSFNLAVFLFVFLFTVYSQGASNYTGVGRVSIQLAPGFLYLTALLANEILTRGGIRRFSAAAAQ